MELSNLYRLKDNRGILISLFFFALIACFFNSKCSPLYIFNEWSDPNIYFSIGKGMFNGKVVYKDLFDHKGPLIFFIYGIGYLVSNTTFLGIYLIQSVLLFISMLYAYRIARLFIQKEYAFIVSLSYSILLFSKSGTGGSADEFIVPAITISFYYFLAYFRKKYPTDSELKKVMLIQGFTFAYTFLIKFSVCVFWIPLTLAICYHLYKQKQYQQIVKNLLYFLSGCAVLVIPFIIYFAANSAIPDFVFAYFTFNSMYANTGFTMDSLLNIVVRIVQTNMTFYIAFPLIFGGLLILLFSNYIKETYYKIAIFFAFIFLYMPIVNSRDHHLYAYIVVFIFALISLIFILNVIEKRTTFNKKLATPIYIVSFITLLGLGIYHQQLFHQDIDCLLRKKEYTCVQKEFAKVINQRENPTLLDLGLDKGIFTASNIVPSYKYFFHPAIREEIFPEIKEYQIELVKHSEPTFVVAFSNHFPYLKENYDVAFTYENLYLFEKKQQK